MMGREGDAIAWTWLGISSGGGYDRLGECEITCYTGTVPAISGQLASWDGLTGNYSQPGSHLVFVAIVIIMHLTDVINPTCKRGYILLICMIYTVAIYGKPTWMLLII